MSAGMRPIERAMAAHREGRHKEAEATYRRILRQRPRDPDALHFLGLLHLQRGDPARAYDLMRQSLEVAPGNHHAWINLGNTLMRQGVPADAQRAYERAIELAPDSIEAWFDLGVCHRRQKAGAKAAVCLIEALKLRPDMVEALEALARIYYQVGQFDRATEVYQQWVTVEPDNPIPRHMLAASSRHDVPQRADDSYVKRVFDEFADHFDENLAELGYQAPQLIADAIAKHVDTSGGDLDILDAGCGTGLCGKLLKSAAGHLCGVDLSPGMLARAEERAVYDELVESELCAFMRSRPAAFDVVVIADTLVYFGALEEALEAARLTLRPAATLAFTVERLDDPGGDTPYRIEPHGRYSHAAAYIDRSLDVAGFDLIERSDVVLRRERGTDVAGLLVVGRRRTG
jgi:predicted TPR repeat methyltransferase